MDNKVLVSLIVPEIEQTYDIYLPINRKMGNIIILLNKAINELSNNIFPISEYSRIYNADTMEEYSSDILIANTNIKNGSKLVILA